MTPLLLALTLKTSVIVGAALVVSGALRRHAAATRHWILAAALIAALAVPALSAVVPAWPLPPMATLATTRPASPPVAGTPSRPSAAAATAPPREWRSFVPTIWAAGVLLNLAWLATGIGHVSRVRRRARPIAADCCTTAAADVAADLGITRPVRLAQSDSPAMLATVGLLRPTIILPHGSEAWPAARLRTVLRHELAHIRRGDWATQLLAELFRSIYWFNPLAWLAARRLRFDSERACDDMVMAAGVGAAEYASDLLAVATLFSARAQRWSPAPAMAHASSLERRVTAMFDDRLRRVPPTRSGKILIAAAMTILCVSLAAAAQNSFSSFSGSIVDPQDGLLPNARLTLVNGTTGARYEVQADRAGRFEFVGLPPAEYALEVQTPGFSTLRGRVTIAGENVQRDIRLAVSSISESITVTAGGAPGEVDWRGRRRTPTCTPGLAPGAIGGNLRPPLKLRHVPPVYPDVPDAQPEEVVLLDAVVAADGAVRDVTARAGAAAPAFSAAAIDAVGQWQFSETLLNCVPIEVAMEVRVAFRR